ncbi:MAG: VLRF1 family aeRF1-type release factor [Meiothermus sp.]|nr:VLRF1 family aeRF1-type release factor [Meiothermus sp.]
MLTQAATRHVREFVVPRASPVFSLYLDTAARPANQGKAYALRVKEALKALEVPRPLARSLLSALEAAPPQGRSRIVFAGQGLMEIYDLQAELPLVQGVEARWGEPYLTPLLYLLEEYPRVGVVFLDSEKWRMFEVFLGEIEELSGAFRPVDPGEWRQLRQDGLGRRYSQGMTLGGGADSDHFERRLEAWTYRFYKQMVGQLEGLLHGREIQRLVLMGQPSEVQTLETLLPRRLREKVWTVLPALTTPSSHADEVLRRVEAALEPLERQRESELVDGLIERGVGGLDQTLELLQQGRLRLVVAPWNLQGQAYRAPDDWVGGSTEGAIAHGAGRIQDVELRRVLPELCQRYATRLEFVRGQAETRLVERLGGLAGLERW